MKVKVEEVTEITRRLEVTVPASEVAQELDAAYEAVGQKAKLKGFRPGKVPRPVLEKQYKGEVEAEAAQKAVSKTYPKALDQGGVSPVSYPQISIKKFSAGEDLVYEAVVEIRPQVNAKGYTGLELTKNRTEASPDEVEKALESLRQRSARLEPILETRGCQSGDVVLFDYQASKNGQPLPEIRAEAHMAELGAKMLLPDFEKGLFGMKPGETRKVTVTYPADWGDKKIAGQKLEYTATLKEIKKKQLPELNDEFAKDLNLPHLDQVREKLKEQILREKEMHEKNLLSREIVQKLFEKNKFPVPEGMIEVELEAMYRNFTASLRQQGLTLEQTGIAPETFVQKNREEAKFRVTGALLLEAIAKKENVTVLPENVEERIEVMAKNAGQAPAAWKKYYKENNLLASVEAALREEKTLDFILSKAKIKIKTNPT